MPREYVDTIYYADDDTQYRVRVTNGWTNATYGLWAELSTVGKPRLPQGMIMRHAVLLRVGGSGRRQFPIQALSGGSGWTVGRHLFLPNNAGAFVEWVVTGLVGQKFQPRRYRRKRS